MPRLYLNESRVNFKIPEPAVAKLQYTCNKGEWRTAKPRTVPVNYSAREPGVSWLPATDCDEIYNPAHLRSRTELRVFLLI
jgi:hypothetical protein